MMKKIKKFSKSYTWLTFIGIISIIAGLGMMIYPENTWHWVIRGVGLLWVMEGIGYFGDIVMKYLNKELEEELEKENEENN